MFLHIGCVFIRNKSTSAFCLKGKELRACAGCVSVARRACLSVWESKVCVSIIMKI